MAKDYTRLPTGLPMPKDDGAADHLEGTEIPVGIPLASTQGGEVDVAAAAAEAPGPLVAYLYPRTGVPGEPLLPGWDDIPGARGCTPQSCAYRDALTEFGRLGATVIGISAQSPAEQAEFAEREHIPFALLADPGLALAAALRLPTFEAGGMMLYRRLTMVIEDGRVARAFYPVFPPDRDAAEVLAWLEAAGRPPVDGGAEN